MSDLRDLARQIDALAQAHPAYSESREIVAHCCSMLQLLSGYREGILAVAAFSSVALKTDLSPPGPRNELPAPPAQRTDSRLARETDSLPGPLNGR
jgi:hypothetical protein